MKWNATQVTIGTGLRVSTQMNAALVIVVAMGPVLIQLAVIIVLVTQVTNIRTPLALTKMNVMMALTTVIDMLIAKTTMVDTVALANLVTLAMD